MMSDLIARGFCLSMLAARIGPRRGLLRCGPCGVVVEERPTLRPAAALDRSPPSATFFGE
jgi:hypothetical protein